MADSKNTCLSNNERKSLFKEELGIKVKTDMDHCTPKTTKTFYNPTMSICRELVLSALVAFVDDFPEKKVECLDAFGATGIAGLQWKKHLGSKVKITINDMNTEAANNIRSNCKLNDDSITNEDTKQIEVLQQDANVVMHQRQFDFIYMDPFGTTVPYLMACFHNVRHGGVVVLTSTDVATLYAKSPRVCIRNYSSRVVRTDYIKETATRIVIAEAIRSAAKCNKGLEILVTVSVEHFVIVIVRVHRAPRYADMCQSHIRQLMHCQMCEERCFYPSTNTPIDNPVKMLPCHCNDGLPTKAVITFGPMWTGPLLCTQFLHTMLKKSTEMNLSSRLTNILTSLILESECPSSEKQHTEVIKTIEDIKRKIHEKQNQTTATQNHGKSLISSETNRENNITDESNDSNSHFEASKRPLEDPDECTAKKRKMSDLVVDDDAMPPFYYSLPHLKMGKDYPKIHRLLTLMHNDGYRASRTHFHPESVRTNASKDQLKHVIMKYNSKS